MMLHNFREMEDFVLCQSKTKKLAVACAQDTLALDAVAAAVDKKIVTAVLIGKVDEICRILTDMGRRPSDFEMIQEDDDRKAVDLAVKMVREGAADIPMKGLMHTSTFMKGILDKETGLLPQGALVSQDVYKRQEILDIMRDRKKIIQRLRSIIRKQLIWGLHVPIMT